MPSCVVADSCSSRSHAPAWECSAAAPAARHSHPAPALADEARRWSVGTCSHAGACEREDKRNPLLPPEKFGPTPRGPLAEEDHARNNLPDLLRRWKARDDNERERPRTAQSFCVPKAEIAASGTYDLSLNRYREVEHVHVEHDAPADIVRELREIKAAISAGLTRLEGMLG